MKSKNMNYKKMKYKCRARTYTSNEIIFRSPFVCWGFGDLRHCPFLEECLKDHIEVLSKRKINLFNKEFGFNLKK